MESLNELLDINRPSQKIGQLEMLLKAKTLAEEINDPVIYSFIDKLMETINDL
jgi:hypothetical protein